MTPISDIIGRALALDSMALDIMMMMMMMSTSMESFYATARLSNKIILSNEIVGPVRSVPVFILVDEDRGTDYHMHLLPV